MHHLALDVGDGRSGDVEVAPGSTSRRQNVVLPYLPHRPYPAPVVADDGPPRFQVRHSHWSGTSSAGFRQPYRAFSARVTALAPGLAQLLKQICAGSGGGGASGV